MIKVLRNMDKKLLIISGILFACGLLMIYSSSNVTAYMLNDASPGRYFTKELIFLGTGVFAAFFVLHIKTKSYYFWSCLAVFVFGIIILLLALYGTVVNGATGWIGYNGYGIQPSEFIKIFIIPFFALYYEKYKAYSNSFVRMYLPLIISFIITGLIVMQNDYGTALIFLALSCLMFLLSSASRKLKAYFLTFVAVICLIGVLLITFAGDKFLDSDKLARFNYTDPCERYLTTGNQLCNGYIAINGGGLFGKGFGNSTQKYLYLPEAHTDFIFAIIIEELGIVGGVVLLILYALLLLEIIHVGKKSYNYSHKLICYGIAIYIFLHIIVNLGGVLGLVPVTGIPLPFMSYGGSICWSILIALALVSRISYETKMKNLKKA